LSSSSSGAFRLGDIRGIYPDEINEDFVRDFAHAFVGQFGLVGRIATGRDMRDSSGSLQDALNQTLSTIGIDVVDIGLCPTELGYYTAGTGDFAASIVVTASHNPSHYNGLKCVLRGGHGITHETGLDAIRDRMSAGYRHSLASGSLTREDYHSRYLDFLSQHFSPDLLHGNIALNGLNGTAATMAGTIVEAFSLDATWFREHPGPMPPDGADPANPALTAEMQGFMADDEFRLGVAWDGDCDRCVFFDGEGQLVPTYYIVGLLAASFLEKNPGSAIVFDTKLCWNTIDIISAGGGKPVPAETGHAFMKQKMQESGAIYGGELSSHHYFGDFFGCDSGMFAWLTVFRILSERDTPIADLIEGYRQRVCCTHEISLSLSDVDAAIDAVLHRFSASAVEIDRFDGVGITMPGDWRFSLKRSKTEPLVRINFEARDTPDNLLNEGRAVFNVLEEWRIDDEDWLAGFVIQ